jgi:uncharacterized protein (DUF433 family)
MDYRAIITIEPGKRGGRPCIRNMRIAVADVLGWLAIRAALAYAADRERRGVRSTIEI